MAENIPQGCSTDECGTKPACSGCSHNTHTQEQPKKPAPRVRKVIGVVSGKGGVGKSLIAGTLAVMLRRRGLKVGVLDADITGPSVPYMFGVHEKAYGDGESIFPAVTESGIRLISVNLMLPNDEDPVVWRGPILASAVEQFWQDVDWGELDVMVIDMPPGTGDVPLTVYQTIPLDGVIIVTTPQDLVGMIVRKAINMASMMKIPVLGLVENMSYALCPDCGKHIEIFGKSHTAEEAMKQGIPLLAQLPFNPQCAALCDQGKIEDIQINELDAAAGYLAGIVNS